jgi:hypothetical protein
MHALNNACASEDLNSVIQLSARFIFCLELSETMCESTEAKVRPLGDEIEATNMRRQSCAQALVMQAEAFFNLSQFPEALSAASKSFLLSPSVESFSVQFQCHFHAGDVKKCKEDIQVKTQAFLLITIQDHYTFGSLLKVYSFS